MSGIKTTFTFLSQTENTSASELLVRALEARDRTIRENALTAVLNRRHCSGHRILIERWHQWSDRWKTKIAENSTRIAGPLRDALVSKDDQVQKNGCEAVLWCREYDLGSNLLTAALELDDQVGERASATLLQLCELLYDDLHGPKQYQRRRDPSLVKRHISRDLSNAIRNPDAARNPEIVESFLLLTSKDNTSLRQSLDARSAPRYKEFTDILKSSQRPGVIRLVCELMQVQRVPIGAAEVISERCDVPFVRRLLKSISDNPGDTVNRNSARIKTLAWLDPQRTVLAALNDEEQAAAVRFVCRSGVDERRTLEFLREVMKNGKVGGRVAVAELMTEFRGYDANDLILTAIEDESAEVQKAVLPIFMDRSIPGAISRLARLVESPDRDLRQMVRECLAEFTFARFMDTFDTLDEDTRWLTGELVTKIEPNVHEQLVSELDSNSRMRRIKALQIAPMVKLVDEVINQVFELLEADDDFTRAEAATALGYATLPSALDALRGATNDANSHVSNAAGDALERFSSAPTPASKPAPTDSPSTPSDSTAETS